ncbi:hypothetical protein DUNSADRAFT_685 [Dunaliella salina]|uniref:Encoded protein n=1 Tax=Dunaliella salina TaxID=3046 RepID=A0ABQ7FYK0_DUNSA|nr:hypothetical protein DUNSADRAFT_685 [Dunaliella salina]|eukprot:KAF5827430.1 hypothetical protein DUNSADRAFT_685 [Dunaliella salina]
MGEVFSSSSSRFWVLAITGSAAAAGLGYLAYIYLQGGSKEGDKQDVRSTVPSETATARLRIARSIQMQTLVGSIPKRPTPSKPSQPVRQTPKQGGTKVGVHACPVLHGKL